MKRYVKAARNSGSKVKIFMEFINYMNEVNESSEIASFASVNWAKPFLKDLVNKVQSEDNIRYKIEIGGQKAYITKDGENQFVNSL